MALVESTISCPLRDRYRLGKAFNKGIQRVIERNPEMQNIRIANWLVRPGEIDSLHSELRDPHVFDKVILKILDDNPFVRAAACRILGDIDDNRAVEPLCGKLTDEHLAVREEAAKALGWVLDLRSVLPLCAALKDFDPIVLRAAISALGSIGDTRAVEPICEVLGRRKNEDVRTIGARALGWLGDQRAEPVLRDLLVNDDNELSRHEAAHSLGSVGDKATADWLDQFLDDDDVMLRLYLSDSIGQLRIEGRKPFRRRIARSIVPRIVDVLEEEGGGSSKPWEFLLAKDWNRLRELERDAVKYVRFALDTFWGAEDVREFWQSFDFDRFMSLSHAKAAHSDTDSFGPRRLWLIRPLRELVMLKLESPRTKSEPRTQMDSILEKTIRLLEVHSAQGQRHIIRVPPVGMNTCHKAAAWIAGFDNPDDYRPILET